MRKILLLCLLTLFTFATYSQVMFVATLTGDQEVPSINTPATATAYFVLHADSSMLSFRITYANLDGDFIAAFFHEGTFGTEGAIIQDIPFFDRNTTSRNWKNVPASVITKLLKEDVYVNIRSTTHPNGEIRGQLRRVNGVGFTASLFGGQEIPPVETNAEGTAWVVITNKASEIKYSATVAGLTSSITSAQICNAAFGSTGAEFRPVTFSDSTASGTITSYPDNIITELLRNRLYINVKTSLFPQGEIRAQFFRQGEIMFKISLDPDQECPPISSSGKGTGWAVFSSNLANLKYSITHSNLGTSIVSASFRHALPGLVGPFLGNINFTGNQANYTTLGVTDSLLRFLLKGEVYVNLTTFGFPNGEIRGQLEPINGIGFTSTLNAQQQLPPANSPGVGTGWIVFGCPGSEVDTACYRFTIAGLTSQIATSNFYNAGYGASGNIIEPIIFTQNNAESKWVLADEPVVYQLFKGFLYAGVNTVNNPDGEIRGQVYYSGVSSGTATIIEDKFVGLPEGFTLNQNYPNPFNPSTKIKYSVPNDGFVKLRVYNIVGQEVALLVNHETKAGTYEVTWNAGKLSSGVYFYRLESGKYSTVKKMTFLK